MESFEELALSLNKPQKEVTESVETIEEVVETIEEVAETVDEPSNDYEEPTIEDESSTSKSSDDSVEEEDLNLIVDWDSDVEVPVETDVTSINYQEIGKALDLEISDKETLVIKVNELKTKLKELESQKDSLYSDIPENLKQAVELAKQGGDFMTLLNINSIDYTSYDPVDIFENEVVQMFTDEAGNVNEEKVTEYLDSVSDIEKEINGKKLQNQYIAEQRMSIERHKNQEAERKRIADNKLKTAINTVDNIAGYKLNPSHKQNLYNDIVSGKLFKELFYDDKGNYDFNKVIEVGFKAKNFDKIQNHLKTKIKNSTKKEIITNLTNSDVRTTPELTKPNVETQTPLDAYISSLEKNLLQ